MSANDLTLGSIPKTMFKLSVSTAIGLICVQSFMIVDLFLVSGLGILSLAAYSVTFQFTLFINSFCLGLGQGMNAIVSNAIGKGEVESAKTTTTISLFLCVFISLVAAIAIYNNAETMVFWFAKDPEVQSMAVKLLEINAVSFPCISIMLMASNISRTSGDAKLPMKLMILAATLNLILDIVLIFGINWYVFEIPAMGVLGAAYASLIARLICASLGIYFICKNQYISLKISRIKMGFACKKIKEIGHYSWLQIVAQSIYPALTAVTIYFVSKSGSDASAAYGLVNKVEAIALIGAIAIVNIVGPFIGQNNGASRLERVVKGYLFALTFCFCWCMSSFAILLLLGDSIISLFTSSATVIALSIMYFSIVPIGYFFDMYIRVSTTTATALKERTFALKTTVFRLVVFLPIVIILEHYYELKGVFIAMPLSFILTAIVARSRIKTVLHNNAIQKAKDPDVRVVTNLT